MPRRKRRKSGAEPRRRLPRIKKKEERSKAEKKTDKAGKSKRKSGLPHVPYGDLLKWTKADRKKSRGAYTSRAYDTTKKRAVDLGYENEDACTVAKKAYAAAAVIHDEHAS